ncbi:hypothetical protein ACFQPF_09565 [Fictibacillus iocasae]|uniref:Uncharacterized protein n=1 Tax=Fictibacillus iocasae TaxID=2715437 RepID=A0ABW2NTG9_9BACL
MTIVTWFLETYKIAVSEIKLLNRRRKDTTSTMEKIRIFLLQYFNLLLIIIYTFSLTNVMVSTLLAIFYKWIAIVGVLSSLLFIIALKFIQKKVYTKMRDGFIKFDPRLVKF